MAESNVSTIKGRLVSTSLDGLLVLKPENWRYVSGFTGDSGVLLVTRDQCFIFTDSRYAEQAKAEAPDFQVVMTVTEKDLLKDVLDDLKLTRVGFEKDHITYAGWERLKKRLESQELIGVSHWVEDLRARKSAAEVEFMIKAQEITDDAFGRFLPSIKAGAKEVDLAIELEFIMRKMGSDGIAFPVIAVSGSRSSLPHGVPTERKLQRGDFVTFDFGAKYGGYCSDMTRTVVVGSVGDKHRAIYETVLKAQLAALDLIKPGIPAKDVDTAGRTVIENAGYGQYFGHGIGHGVGLDIHEKPSVSGQSEDVLEPGMVITVEPGIYIPGFGGVRIEDLVLVTETGNRNLTQSNKQLIVV